jgi:hypothetical protein
MAGAWHQLTMKSRFLVALTVLVLLLLTLTGCGPAQRVVFDPTAAAGIKKIAIMRVPEPALYTVFNIGGAGMAFGMIGAAAEIAERERKSNAFTTKMKEQQFEPANLLVQTLATALRGKGYDTSVVTIAQPVATAGHSADDSVYAQLDADVDALLIVALRTIGYISPAGSSDYVPWINGNAQLFSTKTRAKLYLQVFSSGWDPPQDGIAYLPPPQGYAYPNFDTLTASPKPAQKGIERGLVSLANFISHQLSKRMVVNPPAVEAPPTGEPGT